jgi:hypothetical protein
LRATGFLPQGFAASVNLREGLLGFGRARARCRHLGIKCGFLSKPNRNFVIRVLLLGLLQLVARRLEIGGSKLLRASLFGLFNQRLGASQLGHLVGFAGTTGHGESHSTAE